ncbi:hypothetical protein ACHHYP_13539 [Achlya hypogyna]|uniref:Uncharacterized protein n=1 Tax=Achlya hypogyna TaxID=1202772 RepID=A0A1V9YF02_ACHHY|nr:hypothetical protein ACHHYP_13539 [Achlya hypogyna]
MGCRLLPETFERIALFVPSPVDVRRLLAALTAPLLTVPMTGLLGLFLAVERGQLIAESPDRGSPPRLRLWPTLELPQGFSDAVLLPLVLQASPLYPFLDVDDFESQPVLPSAKLALSSLLAPVQLETTPTETLARVVSLTIKFGATRVGESPWGEHAVERLCNVLPTLRKLESLTVTWGRSHLSHLFPAVLASITATSLTKLALRFFTDDVIWTSETVAALQSWLATAPVRSLGLLRLHAADDACMSALAQAIAASPTLDALHITNGTSRTNLFTAGLVLPGSVTCLRATGYTPDDIPHILATLQRAPALQRLSVGFRRDPTVVVPDAAARMCSALQDLPRLRQVELPSFALAAPCHVTIAALLPRLVRLDLSANELTDNGVTMLAEALPACRRLETLQLCNQYCSDTGALAVASGVMHCPTLQKLDLSQNNITCAGATALAAVLPQLNEVDLCYNNIGFHGAAAISAVLAQTEAMAWLDLQHNPLTLRGVVAIVDAVGCSQYRRGNVQLSLTLATADDIATCRRRIDRLPDPAWCLLSDEPRDVSTFFD